MRSGKHLGSIKWINDNKELQIDYEFTGDLAGTGVDVYKLISDDELSVMTTLENKNGKNTSTKIYTRKK